MSKVRNYALTAKYASLILPTWSCSRMQIMRTWQFLKKVHIECNQSTFFMSLYQAICFLVSHFIYRSAWHISPSASDKTLSHIQKIRTGNINENWKLPPHLKTWLEEHSRTVTLPMRPFRRYEKKKTIDSLRVETVNLRCKAFHLQTTNITTYLQHKNVNDETLNIC